MIWAICGTTYFFGAACLIALTFDKDDTGSTFLVAGLWPIFALAGAIGVVTGGVSIAWDWLTGRNPESPNLPHDKD